jgi:DNA replication and repair protein RecF
MQLRHLSLTSFRNFARLETDLSAGPTLVVGANAQGKTSLLEAIAYLTTASSIHAASDWQLINFLTLQEATPFARIAAEVHRGDRLQRIEIRIVAAKSEAGEEGRLQKEVLLNGIRRRVSELSGGLNAVVFQPHDLVVVEGAPSERRRYLDLAISQADTGYASGHHEYARVVAQRNALLRQLQEDRRGLDQLEFWDDQLAELGSVLMRARALAVVELERLASPLFSELTRNEETLGLEYLPSAWMSPAPSGQLGLPMTPRLEPSAVSRQAIRAALLEAVQRQRMEEIARGVTLIGPHRDELRMTSNGLDLRMYGSRGQNRTAMLALKLAEAAWLLQRTGERPVLLLDEVLAELDTQRREDLLARVFDSEQALLTSADLGMFPQAFQRRAAILSIHGGRLLPASA